MQEDQYCSLLNREREEYCNDQNRNEDEGFRQSSCQRNDDEHIEMKHNYHGYCAKYQQEQDCLPMNIESQDGFVYRKPLLIPRICIEEGHYMGKATSLIILYNLALAHHLVNPSLFSMWSQCDLDTISMRSRCAQRSHLRTTCSTTCVRWAGPRLKPHQAPLAAMLSDDEEDHSCERQDIWYFFEYKLGII